MYRCARPMILRLTGQPSIITACERSRFHRGQCDHIRPERLLLPILAWIMACFVLSIVVTSVAVIHERSTCIDNGGRWTIDRTATTLCQYR